MLIKIQEGVLGAIRKTIKIIGIKWINFEISTIIAFIHKNLKNSSFNPYFHLIVKI